MRRFLLAALLLLLSGALFAELQGYPKTIIAEDFTAGCANCTDSYSGLDVVHSQYDRTEFNSVRYYPLAHPLGNPETDALFELYDVTYTPYVFFNGIIESGGGGSVVASGEPYLEIMQQLYFQESPIKLEINSFNAETGDIQATVEMLSPTYTLENKTIKFLLLEDDVISYETHVTRDIIKDNITLQGQGNTTFFQNSFKTNDEWVTENLQAVAFVQVNGLEIIQSASTYPTPQYKVRGWVPFPLQHTSGVSGSYSSENFAVVNFGDNLDATAELIVDSAPAGWQIFLADDQNTYTEPVSFNLAANENKIFYYKVESTSSGSAEFHLQITSDDLEEPYEIPFNFAVNTANETEAVPNITQIYNFPNPFNPSTSISWKGFSQNEQVKVQIFNSKGQIIRRFTNIENNHIEWNGKDNQDNIVNSGIYFYKVSSKEKSMYGKMLLLK
jgi:hypothetical protein